MPTPLKGDSFGGLPPIKGKATFYMVWHGTIDGKKTTCPIRSRANSKTYAEAEASDLIRQGESQQKPGYVTHKFTIQEVVKEYPPPFT